MHNAATAQVRLDTTAQVRLDTITQGSARQAGQVGRVRLVALTVAGGRDVLANIRQATEATNQGHYASTGIKRYRLELGQAPALPGVSCLARLGGARGMSAKPTGETDSASQRRQERGVVDGTASDMPSQGRLRRRRNILIGVVILALMASIGGLLISTTIKSPAQLAAQTRPPGLTRLTTTVQRHVISDTVLAQGVVSKPPEISGPPGGGGGGGAGGAQPIVTRIFLRPGSPVRPGQPILEVAGRPVFVFQGTYPAYRDLAPRESGPDVAQLQANLQALGYSTGLDSSGVFGAGTSAAVTAFYKNIGYSAPSAGGGPKGHGVMVPLSEFMFVPSFPASVVSLGGKIGGTASGSLVTLSMGRPGIKGQLNPADAKLVRPGMAVTITDPVTGKTRKGRVVSISTRAKTKGSISGGIYLPMKVHPDKPLPASMVGQNLSITISAAHSSGPVLTVPEAAVFASADGGTYVSKVTGAHSQEKVAVRVGITGGGLVQVTPLHAGALTAGAAVVTGQGYASSGKYTRRPGAPGARRVIVIPGG
jgi:peptidoglycan hydrolase-like protein with peptidoglycan-binding domain